MLRNSERRSNPSIKGLAVGSRPPNLFVGLVYPSINSGVKRALTRVQIEFFIVDLSDVLSLIEKDIHIGL